jgi:hypothetical protein
MKEKAIHVVKRLAPKAKIAPAEQIANAKVRVIALMKIIKKKLMQKAIKLKNQAAVAMAKRRASFLLKQLTFKRS